MGVVLPLLLIFFCCLIIWRACDGFESASEYIGRNLSEGVRGGTINAISSSLPELLTTLIALFVITNDPASGAASNEDSFSMGIGTTAGSALFNGMIIPAACILTVIGTVVLGSRVTSVNVSTKVLLRDGLSLIFCEVVLVLFINGTKLHWWHGLLLIALYGAYLTFMLVSMRRNQASAAAMLAKQNANGTAGTANADDDDKDEHPDKDAVEEERSAVATLFYWLSLGPLLDLESMLTNAETPGQIKAETWNAWPLLLAATGVIAVACWFLVEACEWLGSGADAPHHLFGLIQVPPGFGMPVIFVAIIFASMATSVPDTVMSIRDARDGDYDDAVANALGSNIFDICFALGFPLFLYTMIFQKPIEMGPAVAAQSAELRFILLCLTIVGFFVYFLGKRTTGADGAVCVQMKRGKAFLLLLIYAAFAAYILCLGFDVPWAQDFSRWLQENIISHLPKLS